MTTLLSCTTLMVALAAASASATTAPQTRAPHAIADEQRSAGMIGIVLAKAGADDPLLIQRVIGGGPAQAAGLLPDDRILAINDADTDTLTLDEAADRIRGPIGTWVTLAILSGEDRFDLSIQRATVTPEPGLRDP